MNGIFNPSYLDGIPPYLLLTLLEEEIEKEKEEKEGNPTDGKDN